VNSAAAARIQWKTAATAASGLVCVAAAVWVLLGGQSAGLLASVDLGFHELGHLLFALGPGLIPALAGSAVQLAVPLVLAAYFAARREPYAVALILAWAATSAANVATYVADAPYQYLPLLGNGQHDWAAILGGNLGLAAPLAAGIRYFGVALALLGAVVAITSLAAPRLRSRAQIRHRAESEAREAALRAAAPRRESLNLPRPTAREQAPPSAPAGRF
jgi:hypothetical protein